MTIDCRDPEFEGVLVEYALGILGGRERAQVVEHLATCPTCTHTLDGLMQTIDSVALATPDLEPPVGFESKVIGQLVTAPRRKPSKWTAMIALAASLVVVAVMSVALRGGGTSSQSAIVRMPLLDGRSNVGTVYAQLGSSRWMVLVSSQHTSVSRVQCIAITDTNRSIDLGTFAYGSGTTSWPATLPVAARHIRSIQLRSANGVVVASTGSSSWYTTYSTPPAAAIRLGE